MAQATSGEIACADWSRRVTYPSLRFPIGPVRIAGLVSHFIYKKQRKKTLKIRKN